VSELIPDVLAREYAHGDAAPVVFDSPHSGRRYPADFGHIADALLLRHAEDAYIEELYAAAPAQGATLIHALFPRSYIDPNRGEDEIDQAMLAAPWPRPLCASAKTELGMSLIWRLYAPGKPMYSRRLGVAEVERRLAHYYRPYHDAVRAACDELHARHGAVWLVDCHSMPSVGNAMSSDNGRPRPDFTVSDRIGATCSPAFLQLAVDALRGFGYEVRVNDPYQGAELIRRHGRPAERRESLQIEVNRKLYMDEATLAKHAGFARLQAHLSQLAREICSYARSAAG
jgi:N-formylglutamate deformylase